MLWCSHRVLSLLLSFLALAFLLSPSRVWVNVRPAVVLFYDLALLVLRLICSPLFYAGRRHPPTSFIFQSP